MKEINIRFKTKEEFYKDSEPIPFIITIDGVTQENVNRFAIDLKNDVDNLDDYTYTIEKLLKYPTNKLEKDRLINNGSVELKVYDKAKQSQDKSAVPTNIENQNNENQSKGIIREILENKLNEKVMIVDKNEDLTKRFEDFNNLNFMTKYHLINDKRYSIDKDGNIRVKQDNSNPLDSMSFYSQDYQPSFDKGYKIEKDGSLSFIFEPSNNFIILYSLRTAFSQGIQKKLLHQLH
jgi:hypothetical protein